MFVSIYVILSDLTRKLNKKNKNIETSDLN